MLLSTEEEMALLDLLSGRTSAMALAIVRRLHIKLHERDLERDSLNNAQHSRPA